MKENKSIDGLSTRGAKKSSTKSTPEKKPTKKPKSIAVKSSSEEELISDDNIKISVNDTVVTTEVSPAIRAQAIEDFLKPATAFSLDEPSSETSPNPELKSEPETKKKDKKDKKDKEIKKDKSAKKSLKKSHKILIAILAVIFILLAAGCAAMLFFGDIIAKISDDNFFGAISALTSETYEPLKTDDNGRTNILAFGTSGYNMDGDEGNGIHDGAQLTDSIMMISLNQETGDIAMLSLPRDLKASPTCTATGKINEVYWCNNMSSDDEKAGAAALMAEVGSILGVDFQYYAHLNWGALVDIVDILDGITITLDEDIMDYYWTGAVYQAGVEYTLNGEEALGLARARHGTAGGDFSRGASQQKILIGIKNKVFEKNLSISDLLSLASTLGDNLRTNFTIGEMKTLAHFTDIFDLDSMRQISLYPDYMTTGSINGISYVLPRAGVGNYGIIQNYVATKLDNDPRTYEEPTILVLNATDIIGLASTERAKLTAYGYKNIDTDNAPESEYDGGYILYSNHEKPGTEDLLEDYYSLESKDYEELPADISQEYDFVIIVNITEEV